MLHSMTTKLKGKERFVTLKLDMSKAYDMIEWDFLKVAMIKMGFHHNWVELIMACISSVSFFLVNGISQVWFQSSWRIRQGEHLSPYLFITYAKASSSLLLHAELSGWLSTVPLDRGPLRVNCLLFADNYLLFCKANSLERVGWFTHWRYTRRHMGRCLTRIKRRSFLALIPLLTSKITLLV